MKRRFSFLLFWSALIAAPTYAQSLEEEANDIPGLEYLYELVYRDSTFGGGLRDILPEGYVTPEELLPLSYEELIEILVDLDNGIIDDRDESPDSSLYIVIEELEDSQEYCCIEYVPTRFGYIPIVIDKRLAPQYNFLIQGSLIKDLTAVNSSRIKKNASIVCAIVFLDNNFNKMLPNGSLLMKMRTADSLCSDVDFRKQRNNLSGTAFAITDTSVCTAYHYGYVTSEIAFVFNYTLEDHNRDTIPADRVFRPTKVISYSPTEEDDYVIYRLNKLLPARFSPSSVSRGIANKGDQVYMLGHPFNWPMKLSFNASVMVQVGSTMYTSLSKMNYNSGSPVFNSKTHELVGMLVKGGSQDFILRTSSIGKCYTYNYDNYSDYKASIYLKIQTILNQQ